MSNGNYQQLEHTDYYELLQISPNAQLETIHRVYRMLAGRYHPDNPETGDAEMFMLLREAYETLSDPAKRKAYDNRHPRTETKPLAVFEMKEFVQGVEGEANRRMGILCLLYHRRRLDPEHPGLSLLDLEGLMNFPREHLLFSAWFLKEKAYLRYEADGNYAITAEGVEFVDSHLPSSWPLYNLLHAPRPELRGDLEPAGRRQVH